MNHAEMLRTNWSQLRPKLRATWMSLTDKEVAMIDGDWDTLMELLKEKYSYSAVQAESQIENFLEQNGVTTVANN